MAENGKFICENCSKIINIRTGKPITCDGDCGKTFHANYDDILKKPDVVSWFCNVCKMQRSNRRSTIIEQIADITPKIKAKGQFLEGDQMSNKAHVKGPPERHS